MGFSQEVVLAGLFVRMLDRHEPDLVDQVILGLGWRISNVLLSWRWHIHRLVAALRRIPERGWRATKSSYRRRGELIRDRLVELNGGVPLFASGPLLEGDRMLRFVQEMVLPWGRMQLRRVRTLTPAEAVARGTQFQIRQVRWFQWCVNYALPIDVEKEEVVRHKQRTCYKCAYQGFELTRALVAAVPGGVGTVRILWAMVKGSDVSKNGPYHTRMKEFDGMLNKCCKVQWDDAPEMRDAGEPPSGMWLAAQSVGGKICCDAWRYSSVLRPKSRDSFVVQAGHGRMVDPHEYGLYGVDDAGTICTPESVFGRWRQGQMETHEKPVPWDPQPDIRFVK